jgi:hypothetical protein
MKNIFIKNCLFVLLSVFISKAEAQSNISSFNPSLSYVYVGTSYTPTVPTPLTVTLDVPTLTPLFISITSSDPGSLQVVGGGVTIPAAGISAQVLFNGIAQNFSVQLTASLGTQLFYANVRVVDNSEMPMLTAINPPVSTINSGDVLTLFAQIDIPSPMGGTIINLSLTPGTAGTIPASITIPANQISSQFSYMDGSVESVCYVTGQLGASQSTAVININSTLNISDSPIESPYSIYPNPFSEKITFTVSDYQPQTISIYNIYSQLILKEVFSNSITINTEQLAKGIYFYEYKKSNGELSKGKIVKN